MALAGFDYKSDSLQNKTNELYVAFVGLTDGLGPRLDSILTIVRDFIPFVRTMVGLLGFIVYLTWHKG